MKIVINISITFITILLAFIGGMIFYHEYEHRWDNEPLQVIACFLCMVMMVALPKLIKKYS